MRKEAKSRGRKVVTQILKECNVVLATCIGSQFHALHGKMFDLVIIDEAAQALEAACWIAALKVSLYKHVLRFHFATLNEHNLIGVSGASPYLGGRPQTASPDC